MTQVAWEGVVFEGQANVHFTPSLVIAWNCHANVSQGVGHITFFVFFGFEVVLSSAKRSIQGDEEHTMTHSNVISPFHRHKNS